MKQPRSRGAEKPRVVLQSLVIVMDRNGNIKTIQRVRTFQMVQQKFHPKMVNLVTGAKNLQQMVYVAAAAGPLSADHVVIVRIVLARPGMVSAEARRGERGAP